MRQKSRTRSNGCRDILAVASSKALGTKGNGRHTGHKSCRTLERRRAGRSNGQTTQPPKERYTREIFTNLRATHGVSHRGPGLTKFPDKKKKLKERKNNQLVRRWRQGTITYWRRAEAERRGVWREQSNFNLTSFYCFDPRC
jgi:hypothetical protein